MTRQSDPVELLQAAARGVTDPVSGGDVLSAGLVGSPRVEGGQLHYTISFGPRHDRSVRQAVLEGIRSGLRELGWAGDISPEVRLPEEPTGPSSIPGVANVVAVASGKGGVGKSTIATNLAVGLARLGYRTGLLDADVYGPSLPRMMGVDQLPALVEDGRIVPVEAHGVRCVSVGLMVPEQEAIIWRGPMVARLVKQFIEQVEWGELDYLVVDLPPGTGDAQLTLLQTVPLTGAIVVTTPQEVALADAVRGIAMFRRLDVPLIGLVETMSWYELPDGTRDYVFGQGGGRRTAQANGTTLLAELPLLTAVRRAGDRGSPIALGDDPASSHYRELAAALVERVPA